LDQKKVKIYTINIPLTDIIRTFVSFVVLRNLMLPEFVIGLESFSC